MINDNYRNNLIIMPNLMIMDDNEQKNSLKKLKDLSQSN